MGRKEYVGDTFSITKGLLNYHISITTTAAHDRQHHYRWCIIPKNNLQIRTTNQYTQEKASAILLIRTETGYGLEQVEVLFFSSDTTLKSSEVKLSLHSTHPPSISIYNIKNLY